MALDLTVRRVVVIDDDPTEGQTVARVPVTTSWEADDLRWLLTADREMGFVLTNSRSMSAERAREVNSLVVSRCLELGAELGIEVSFISRSDSTLRGHFTVEVSTICAELDRAGHPPDLVLVVPAFFQAGRITRDDVHYVQADGHDIPVAETAYARDPVFGFAESNLIDWVRARLGAPQVSVSALTLTDIRSGGVPGVVQQIREAVKGVGCVLGDRDDHQVTVPPVLIVNATEPHDYTVVAGAVTTCESQGLTVVTRSGPSYLSARLGEPLPPAVDEVAMEPPAWIVAKGGITSANMVTRVLQLRRGWIVGQIFTGQLPLWRDDDTSGAKPLCVIFPGNVGSESTLTDVVGKLHRAHQVESTPSTAFIGARSAGAVS